MGPGVGCRLEGDVSACQSRSADYDASKNGAIVNTSSISGILGWPAYAAYSTSKGGVIQFTRQMAVDYAAYSIRVNCICPGTTLTPLAERLFRWMADTRLNGGLFGAPSANL